MDNRHMFIKLYYSLLDWEWSTEPSTFRVFIHLLLTANRKPRPYNGEMIYRGEVLASYEFISQSTGLSIQNVRTAINNLLSTNTITKRKVDSVNVYNIVNYNKWQNSRYDSDKSFNNKNFNNYRYNNSFNNNRFNNNFNNNRFYNEYSDHNIPVHRQYNNFSAYQKQYNNTSTIRQQEYNKRVTNYQQEYNKPLTTLRYCENEENERMRECESVEHTHAYGKLNNVFITDDEYKAFCSQYSFADVVIDELSVKIATGDPKYRTGHLGYLYVFANNYNVKKAPAQPSYDIETAMKRAYALDPTKTKRR